MGNYLNAQYYGELQVGSNRETHEFIFDTGSPWLWISGLDCKYCHTKDLFDSKSSTSFKRVSSERKELFYETGSAAGYVAQDEVCLSEDVCVNEMLFIEVDDTDEMALRYNGVLGLSPGSSNILTKQNKKVNNSYIDQLYKAGLIDKRVFSMYLSDSANAYNTSMFTVGGYDTEKFAPDRNVTWNPVTDKTYWTVKLRKATVGDTMVVTSTNDAIIDSGTSYIAMPTSDLLSLVDMLDTVHGFKCAYEDFNKLYACNCPDLTVYKETFPPLKVTLSESNTYEIPYTDYTQRRSNLCYLTIMPLGEQDFWILGDSFMRNYYAIFDLDNNRVGLAGSYTMEPFQLTFVMLAAYLGIALMVAVVIRVMYLMCKKGTRDQPSMDVRQPLAP